MKKVLVIDDHHHTHRLVKVALTRLGVEIVNAIDGEVGVAAAALELPDLVILDVTMPLRTGREVLRELKGREELRHIPVIMLTAQDDEQEVAAAMDAGAAAFMAKPFHPVELAALVEQFLADPPAAA